MTIYLDNSATTRPSEAVVAAMHQALCEDYYNPSALYAQAVGVEKAMDACRQELLTALQAQGRIVFTSGGTEANNLAILGALSGRRGGGELLYSAGEHPSVIESCKAAEALGYVAREIPLKRDGLIDLAALESLLCEDSAMLCLMQVNNESGAIQPLQQAAELRQRLAPQCILHVDGVQGFLRHPLDVMALKVDSYALSAHKLHGPKGAGALFVRQGHRLQPVSHGGSQEGGLRSGTENAPGIAGLCAAVKHYPRAHEMRRLKLRLYHHLKDAIPELHVNGPDPEGTDAADHILNLSFPPVRAETMLHAMEGEGVLVGTGSACSSRKRRLSHVLQAMGLVAPLAESAIRVSLNPHLTAEDIDRAADAFIKCYGLLKNFRRR